MIKLIASLESLTPRERQVLDLVKQGATNSKTARDLGISPRTVEIHRANALRKLNAKTTPHAIAIYIRSCAAAEVTEADIPY